MEEAIRDATSTGNRPRVLYTVPTAQNPTGAVMTMQRKREIYAICKVYDIIILEDDPYQFLQYPEDQDNVPGMDVEPGYLHLDTDGRVIRIDSFAKSVAPGFRLGWVTAVPDIMKSVICAVQGSTLGPNGPSQVMLHSILAHWGRAGFEKHVIQVQVRLFLLITSASFLAEISVSSLRKLFVFMI